MSYRLETKVIESNRGTRCKARIESVTATGPHMDFRLSSELHPWDVCGFKPLFRLGYRFVNMGPADNEVTVSIVSHDGNCGAITGKTLERDGPNYYKLGLEIRCDNQNIQDVMYSMLTRPLQIERIDGRVTEFRIGVDHYYDKETCEGGSPQ